MTRRNRWIQALHQRGFSFASIGRAFNITKQRVEQIVRHERALARLAAGDAYRNGVIKKPINCEGCAASDELQMHHDDYARRLEVRWLCPRCHTAAHGLVARCRNGHYYSGGNTYFQPSGQRACRICGRAAGAKYRARKAALPLSKS